MGVPQQFHVEAVLFVVEGAVVALMLFVEPAFVCGTVTVAAAAMFESAASTGVTAKDEISIAVISNVINSFLPNL
jgi:hypothetical protein